MFNPPEKDQVSGKIFSMKKIVLVNTNLTRAQFWSKLQLPPSDPNLSNPNLSIIGTHLDSTLVILKGKLITHSVIVKPP